MRYKCSLMNNAAVNIPEARDAHYEILNRMFGSFESFRIVICICAISITEIL